VPDASSEIGYTSRERIWSKLNKCLGVFIAVGIAIPLAYRSLPVVKEKAAQDMKIADLERMIAMANMQKNRLDRDVELLKTDPEYLGIYARDNLSPGYMKEGETIFRIERSNADQ
jgi:cell division protein FtsB